MSKPTVSEQTLLAVLAGMAEKAKHKTTYKDVDIAHSDETGQIVLPLDMSKREAIEWLERSDEQDNLMVAIAVDFDAFPIDGAVCLHRVLKEVYGWSNMQPTPGFFGPSPPAMFDAYVSHDELVQVLWGQMNLPGIQGFLQTSTRWDGKRLKFQISGQVQRRHEGAVRELCAKVREELRLRSIYRGKAFRMSFRPDDRDGDPTEGGYKFDPRNCPRFIKPSATAMKDLVFNEDTQELVETALYAPIRHSEDLRNAHIPLKRGVMLEGPYGTGKSLCATAVATLCMDNQWTFLYCENALDLDLALSMAQQYQPCVVFTEDIDTAVKMDRTEDVNRLLNILDGVTSKTDEIITVLTTNHVNNISKALMRPGRMDAVIPVRPPDARSAVTLIRQYGNGQVIGDEDDLLEAVGPMVGFNAAVFRELVDRSRIAAISRHGEWHPGLKITPDDILRTGKLMQHQLHLLEEKEVAKADPMAVFGHQVGKQIGEALRETKLTMQPDSELLTD